MYITTEGVKTEHAPEDSAKITMQATGALSWRKADVKYRKNEAFVDVIEDVNLLMSATGAVLRADVTGQIIMRAYLSGTPECKFGLNDRLLLDNDGLLSLPSGNRMGSKATKAAAGSSSDSEEDGSDSDADSDDEDVEMDDAAKPAVNGKRKAEAEASQPAKKAKVAKPEATTPSGADSGATKTRRLSGCSTANRCPLAEVVWRNICTRSSSTTSSKSWIKSRAARRRLMHCEERISG